MIVLIKLLSKTNDYVVYSYGSNESNLDGLIKFSLISIDDFDVLQESTIGKLGTLRALCKIRKSILDKEIKEVLSYES